MTAVCEVCGREVRTHLDGRLVNHGPLARPCTGSGEPTAVDDVEDLTGEDLAVVEPLGDLPVRGMFERRPDWFSVAACRPVNKPADVDLADWVDMFFPARGEATAPAKAVCGSCPARDACLDHAMGHGEKHGVWGGASERGRRRARTARRRQAREAS